MEQVLAKSWWQKVHAWFTLWFLFWICVICFQHPIHWKPLITRKTFRNVHPQKINMEPAKYTLKWKGNSSSIHLKCRQRRVSTSTQHFPPRVLEKDWRRMLITCRCAAFIATTKSYLFWQRDLRGITVPFPFKNQCDQCQFSRLCFIYRFFYYPPRNSSFEAN